jgi:hypothetical protein
VGRDSASQRKAKRTTCAQWSAYNRGEAAWLSSKAQTERILSNELLSLTLSCRPLKYKHIEEGEEIEERNMLELRFGFLAWGIPACCLLLLPSNQASIRFSLKCLLSMRR